MAAGARLAAFLRAAYQPADVQKGSVFRVKVDAQRFPDVPQDPVVVEAHEPVCVDAGAARAREAFDQARRRMLPAKPLLQQAHYQERDEARQEMGLDMVAP
jgi:hypothetical protein